MQIYQVDAFTNEAFKGNPAAVCLLDSTQSEQWLQNVAAEMNLSETAFLWPRDDGFDLRWFTPQAEEELCGHATLASSHILWEKGVLASDQKARFHTKSGLLTARQKDGWIFLNFPNEAPHPVDGPEELIKAFAVEPLYIGQNRLDYILEIESESELYQLNPDMTQLKQLQTRGIIVTSKSESPSYDFVSRFFAPGLGISEDPVTGSAHCCLGPYWSSKLGQKNLLAYQASARGGEVKVQLLDERVVLGGQAITVLKCDLLH